MAGLTRGAVPIVVLAAIVCFFSPAMLCVVAGSRAQRSAPAPHCQWPSSSSYRSWFNLSARRSLLSVAHEVLPPRRAAACSCSGMRARATDGNPSTVKEAPSLPNRRRGRAVARLFWPARTPKLYAMRISAASIAREARSKLQRLGRFELNAQWSHSTTPPSLETPHYGRRPVLTSCSV